MKTRYLFISILLIYWCTFSHQNFGQSINETLKKNRLIKGKTVSLFNGKNLDGWYTFLKTKGKSNDPDRVFTVENKLIRVSGTEYGCITTEKEYENYELEVDFKWGVQTHAPRVSAARDNGVLIHSQGKDGAFSGNWMYSLECQIIEGGTGDFLVVGDGSKKFSMTSPVAPEKQGGAYIYKPGGDTVSINGGRINWFARDPAWKDVKDFRGPHDIEKPVGEWNKIKVIAMNDDIYFYLNGVLVNRAMKVRPTSGRIQIQSEGAEMYVRKVNLTPLTQK